MKEGLTMRSDMHLCIILVPATALNACANGEGEVTAKLIQSVSQPMCAQTPCRR
jgi:hypothetical protein